MQLEPYFQALTWSCRPIKTKIMNIIKLCLLFFLYYFVFFFLLYEHVLLADFQLCISLLPLHLWSGLERRTILKRSREKNL